MHTYFLILFIENIITGIVTFVQKSGKGKPLHIVNADSGPLSFVSSRF